LSQNIQPASELRKFFCLQKSLLAGFSNAMRKYRAGMSFIRFGRIASPYFYVGNLSCGMRSLFHRDNPLSFTDPTGEQSKLSYWLDKAKEFSKNIGIKWANMIDSWNDAVELSNTMNNSVYGRSNAFQDSTMIFYYGNFGIKQSSGKGD